MTEPEDPTNETEATAPEPGTPEDSHALPDERHSRTTELAARLRQSALAQVEAARAAQAAGAGGPAAPSPRIPSLDDPSIRFTPPLPTPSDALAQSDSPADDAMTEAESADDETGHQVTGHQEAVAAVSVDSDATPAHDDAAIEEPAVVEEPVAAEEPAAPAGGAAAVGSDETETAQPIALDPIEPTTVEPESLPEPETETAVAPPMPLAATLAAFEHDSESTSLLGAGLADTDEPARGGSPTGLRLATAVVALLTIVAVVLLVIYVHTASDRSAVAKARVEALAAAKTETAAALTYNYLTLNADFAHAEAGMSTAFKANYAQTAATSVAPLAKKTHAVTTGTVADAGVISATASSAKILVFADQTVENKLLSATSRLDRSVIEVSMVKQDGRWVIDDLKPF